jgi:sugar/nucleoside kinase (ribokinase family)
VNHDLHFDYTTIGHVTIDVLDDGSRRAGGSAFYSALQASRLGRRSLIITRGRAPEIEQLLEPYRHELELQILPAPHTTTLQTSGSGASRSQRLLEWAGPITEQLALDTSILHLAPVARESPSSWRGRADFVGLTPQGLARTWRASSGQIESAPPTREAAAVAAKCNAVVVAERERSSCAQLIETASRAVVVVTAGDRPNTILLPTQTAPGQTEPGQAAPAHTAVAFDVPTLEHPLDDLGAGDVFAAALFIALSDGRPPLQAAGFANAAAAVRISGSGADAIGGLAAIEARLSRAAPAR